MMLVLNVHYTRTSDLVIPDHVTTDPSVPIAVYRDGFGNWCTRLVAPVGQIKIASTAIVQGHGRAGSRSSVCASTHPIQDLPEEALVFLLASRYCDSEKFLQLAWNMFGHTEPGWRPRACDLRNSSTTTCHSATSMRAP